MPETVTYGCDGCGAYVEVNKAEGETGIVKYCPYCGKLQSEDVDE